MAVGTDWSPFCTTHSVPCRHLGGVCSGGSLHFSHQRVKPLGLLAVIGSHFLPFSRWPWGTGSVSAVGFYLFSGVFLFWHMSVLFRKLRGFLSDDGFYESRSALGVGDPGLCAD